MVMLFDTIGAIYMLIAIIVFVISIITLNRQRDAECNDYDYIITCTFIGLALLWPLTLWGMHQKYFNK